MVNWDTLPREDPNVMQVGAFDTGYALAAEYFPGLERSDFYAFATDYSLAIAEWDDMVGPGEPDPEGVDRFYREGFGLLFNLLRHVRPDGEWSADADRGHVVRQGMDAAGITSILDFGGGIASMAIWLAQQGYQVGYVDAGETAAFGRWRVTREGLQVFRFGEQPAPGKVACYCDLEDAVGVARFDESPWQAIAALDVLEHLWDPVGMLQAFYDALPPGGLLFLTRHSFKEHPTHLERTFWLFEKADEVLANMGFSPYAAPDGFYGIGAWRRT